MQNEKNEQCWLIGTGYMAQAYANVLNDLSTNYIVIGRGETNATAFEKETGKKALLGGLTTFLADKPSIPNNVIVAVGIESLSSITQELMDYGVKKILLEKPGVGYPSEIKELAIKAKQEDVNILLAYNRRFYSSVMKAEEMIKEDGGVSSFNFEFTEWSHKIGVLDKTRAEWENWFLGNSTHMIDTAFFLGGKPKEMAAFHTGANTLDWHPKSSNYAGAGVSETGALFAYHANWKAPGRWVAEILTPKRRLIFKPVEKLLVQHIGTVSVEPVEIDDRLDIDYKPGVYLQTKAFLENDFERFCDIFEQEEMIEKFYCKMSGY